MHAPENTEPDIDLPSAALPPAAKAPAHTSLTQTIFIGPNGLRAGWSILVFFVLFVAIAFPALWALGHLMQHLHIVTPGHPTGDAAPLPFGLSEGILLFSVLLATAIMARIEHRPTMSYGLAGAHRLRHFVVGLLTGFAFLSLLIGILVTTHHMHLDAPTLPASTLWKYAFAWGCGFMLVAFFEELLLRGYMLFTLARGIYFWPAAILLAILFGAIHKGNPGESPFGLATAAGVALVFSLSLWRIGSLWWAIGFHAAWDWAQSYFYGTPDSGLLSRGHYMTAHAEGSIWLSGGLTGPEGSVWCGLILVLLTAWVWFTQKRTTTPYWK